MQFQKPFNHQLQNEIKMNVIEHLDKATEPLISFEIIPPKRGGSFANLEKVIANIAKYNPPFIDVTSHAAVAEYIDLDDGKQRRVLRRKRPGTLGICSVIQHKYGIDAIPHILCTGFTREETEDLLIDLNYLGIDNVLAIRGDKNGYQKPVPKGKTRNEYASDLVNQIVNMNEGNYLAHEPNASPTNFCIGVAGYPEKHFEAPNIDVDISNLKRKIDAGGSYVVCQIGFDNQDYFSFVEKCRGQGINVPILPGIKIITSKSQFNMIPKTFHIDIPNDFYQEVMEADSKHTKELGINHAVQQTRELLNANVLAVHHYIMQRTGPIDKVMKRIYE